MMAKKHLHELLKEDQEPFHINHYTANRRFQLKRLYFSSPNSSIQLKKRHPITQTSTSTSISKSTFCKHANCLFSFHDSPDKKSSLNLLSPARAKSPQNGRTATLLLEAAMRIQKQQSTEPNTQTKKIKFGYFRSILKRLKDRNSDKKSELKNGENSNNSNVSSGFWSERNEEKFIDFAPCSSACDFGTCDRRYRLSPFRFSLQRCPSSGCVKPDFSSPAASPVYHKKEDKNYETIALAIVELEEADAKDQCSPTSVLDPPFEEDDHDDGHECKDEDDDDEDCDLECSYALVQRAQQQLLYKLRRFEKLAELDPIELEKLMLDADDNDDLAEEEEYQDSDLISEEKFEVKSSNCGRECKRIDSWQEVTSNTIDMMLELELRSEFDEWNKFQKQREETVIEFAFSIFGLLVEELGEELSSLSWISWEPQ